jgi:hypothetical protein
MCYSFFQRSGTLGRYLITEEGYLGRPEDTFCWFNDDPVRMKTAEEIPEMSPVLLEGLGEHEDVIQVGETEV